MDSGGEDSAALELKRQRHNESEKKRRQKVRDIFMELANLVNCNRTQQSAILRVTIDRVHALQDTIDKLQAQNAQLAALPRRDAASPSAVSSSPTTYSLLQPVSGARLSGSGPPSPMARNPYGLVVKTGGPTSSHSASPRSSPYVANATLASRNATSNSPHASSRAISSSYIPSLQTNVPSPTNAGQGSPSLAQVQAVSAAAQARLNGPMSHGEIFLCSALPMFAADLSGRILDVNPSFSRMLNTNRDIVLAPQSTVFDYTHPDQYATAFAFTSEILTSQTKVHSMIKRFIKPDGTSVEVKQHSWVCLDQSKQPAVVVSVCVPGLITMPEVPLRRQQALMQLATGSMVPGPLKVEDMLFEGD